MASTGSWAPWAGAPRHSTISACATRRWRPSWPAPTPSSPERSGVPGHLGAGRDPPAERALRRAHGSSAGAGHRRPAGGYRVGQRLPAGSRSAELVQDVSAYVETVVSPAQLLHVLDRALRVAVGERQVATVIVPNDVQQMAAPKRQPHEHGHVMSAVGFVQPRPYARDADLEAAAAILNRGRRVAILAGAGALGAHRQLEAVAERLAAGVAKALLGKAAVSDDLPYVTGSIGLLGTRASSMLMSHCDTLLIVGSTFPTASSYPRPARRGRCRSTCIRATSVSAIRSTRPCSAMQKPWSACCRCSSRKARRLAPPGRAGGDGQSRSGARPRASRPDQPAAGIPFLVGATAGRCDSLRRQRLAYQLVRPRHPHAPGHARLAVGQAGDHGQRRALRHRRQARLSAAAGGGDGRRRRHADERQRRTGHRAAVLAALGLADLHRAGAEQRRSQPGDLGSSVPWPATRSSARRRK